MSLPWITIPDLWHRKAAPAPAPAPVPAPVKGYPADFANLPPTGQAVIPAGGPVSVSEQPQTTFLGDIQISGTVPQVIDVFTLMGGKCTGLSILLFTGNTILCSINGGGQFSITGTFDLDNATINTLTILPNGATGVLQLRGV